MNAIFKSLVWEKGTIFFVSPEDYDSLPENAIKTTTGDYVVSNPAKLYLTLDLEDGRTITVDIANFVKAVNGWNKISEKRYNSLKNRFEFQNFQVDEEDEIVDFRKIVAF